MFLLTLQIKNGEILDFNITLNVSSISSSRCNFVLLSLSFSTFSYYFSLFVSLYLTLPFNFRRALPITLLFNFVALFPSLLFLSLISFFCPSQMLVSRHLTVCMIHSNFNILFKNIFFVILNCPLSN